MKYKIFPGLKKSSVRSYSMKIMYIYITGSNAKMLSGELATYLSGRYSELKVYSLSYSEFFGLRISWKLKRVTDYIAVMADFPI